MAKQKTQQQRPQQGARKEEKPKEPGTRSEAPPRMLTVYRDTVVPQLTKEFDYANVMRVPRVAKVVFDERGNVIAAGLTNEPQRRR